jgi:hypothetical protein
MVCSEILQVAELKTEEQGLDPAFDLHPVKAPQHEQYRDAHHHDCDIHQYAGDDSDGQERGCACIILVGQLALNLPTGYDADARDRLCTQMEQIHDPYATKAVQIGSTPREHSGSRPFHAAAAWVRRWELPCVARARCPRVG